MSDLLSLPTTAECEDIAQRYKRQYAVITSSLTLSLCQELFENKDQDSFNKDRNNWTKSIWLHPPAVGIQMATMLFWFFYANENNERSSMLAFWEKLAQKASEHNVDLRHLAFLWHQIGIISTNQGAFRKAISCFNRAIYYDKELMDQTMLGSEYYELGMVHRNMGNYQQALDMFRQSVLYANSSGDKRTLIYANGQIANILAIQNLYSEAILVLRSMLELWDTFPDEKDRNLRHTTLNTLGYVYFQNFQFPEAKKVLIESLYYKNLAHERLDAILRTRAILAETCIKLRDFEEATNYIHEADADKCINMGSYQYAASAFKVLSQLRFLQINYPEAYRLANRALDSAQKSSNRLTELEILLWILSIDFRRLNLIRIFSDLFHIIRIVLSLKIPIGQIVKLIQMRLVATP